VHSQCWDQLIGVGMEPLGGGCQFGLWGRPVIYPLLHNSAKFLDFLHDFSIAVPYKFAIRCQMPYVFFGRIYTPMKTQLPTTFTPGRVFRTRDLASFSANPTRTAKR